MYGEKWSSRAAIGAAVLLGCGETSRNEGGSASMTRTSATGTTRIGSSTATSGAGATGGAFTGPNAVGTGGVVEPPGSTDGGGGGGGGHDPISCSCGALEGECHYRTEDFCFALDCNASDLQSTLRGAASFCDGDAGQTMSYCDDGTYRFHRSWGAGENDAVLVFSLETGELVYAQANGYLDTPCGTEGMHAYAGTPPSGIICATCTICEYGEEPVGGSAGAAGHGSGPPACLWSDEGVPLIP